MAGVRNFRHRFPSSQNCIKEGKLAERLFLSTTLVTWADEGAEVGRVHRDDLPDAARRFLQQVDAPTYQANEERSRLKEQGFDFDGAWMPATIRRLLDMLLRAGASPQANESAPWLFRERVTAINGALISLYEITRQGWGFAVRGTDQQEVIGELEAFLLFLNRVTVAGGHPTRAAE